VVVGRWGKKERKRRGAVKSTEGKESSRLRLPDDRRRLTR